MFQCPIQARRKYISDLVWSGVQDGTKEIYLQLERGGWPWVQWGEHTLTQVHPVIAILNDILDQCSPIP